MRLVIFDADGTLVDSQAIIHAAMQESFVTHGHEPLPIESTRSIIGLTLNVAISKLLERPLDDHINKMTETYKSHYLELLKKPEMHASLYDGISKVLADLAEQDETLIAIATGKSRRGLNALIETHKLNDKLVASRCADECPSKPHPAMILECCEIAGCQTSQTVMIGDASFDMQMAVNADCPSIGVTWGYQPRQVLIETGASMTIDKPSEIVAAIDSIFKETDQ